MDPILNLLLKVLCTREVFVSVVAKKVECVNFQSRHNMFYNHKLQVALIRSKQIKFMTSWLHGYN
jgi:hypothetical protein